MKGWIGKILVTILGIGLLVYSATRSVDFIALTLPADRQVLAFFGLAALDGGIIVWLLAFQFGSHGGAQRGISLMMILVDFIGAVAMFTADTIYNTGQAGLTAAFDQNTMMTFVIALSGIIALNIGAGLAFHITDPDHMRKMAEEEAISRIEDQARKQVEENSHNLAAELAPIMGAAWVEQTRARALAGLNKGHTLALPPQIIDGKVKESPAPVEKKEEVPSPAPTAPAPKGYQYSLIETVDGWQMVLIPAPSFQTIHVNGNGVSKNGISG
jgi:hypothetical protein